MQDMAFPRVQNFQIFFRGEHVPGPPMIRAFGTDFPLVSPVTLVLNVQLQNGTRYLDKTNDDTEKQWSKIYMYIILDENTSLNVHQRNYTKRG